MKHTLPLPHKKSPSAALPSDNVHQLKQEMATQSEKIQHLEFLLKKAKERQTHAQQEAETQKQRAEVAEIYLDNVVRNINEHFYWMDREGVMLGCNEQQAKSFGLNTSEELLGKNIYDFLYGLKWEKHIVETIRTNNLHVMRTGKTEIKEEIGFFNDEERTFISYKNPLLNKKGKIIGVFGFSIDITERKRAEEALLEAKEQLERAYKTKTEFLENMRHDLRTPFSGIIGLAQSMEMNETDPEKKDSLDWIVKSSTLVLNILNDILAGANTGIITEPSDYDVFSLQEVATNLSDLLVAEIHWKKLDFQVRVDEQLPPILAGDKMRLQRILLNLLTNAVKFTEKGSVQLHVTGKHIGKEKLELIFIIKDTGIGIPHDKLDAIFEKFVKLKPSFLSNTYVGVGVGLTIVQNLVQELKGTIEVESTEGAGTTFTCVIPFDIPN